MREFFVNENPVFLFKPFGLIHNLFTTTALLAAIIIFINRNKISNTGRKMVCLCREHHNICHKDEVGFFKKYHIYGVYFEDGDKED